MRNSQPLFMNARKSMHELYVDPMNEKSPVRRYKLSIKDQLETRKSKKANILFKSIDYSNTNTITVTPADEY